MMFMVLILVCTFVEEVNLVIGDFSFTLMKNEEEDIAWVDSPLSHDLFANSKSKKTNYGRF